MAILRQFWVDSQCVNVEEIIDVEGPDGREVIRLLVHTDTTTRQAYGVAHRWDGDAWREVFRIPGENLQVDLGAAYANIPDHEKAAACDEDLKTLAHGTAFVTNLTVKAIAHGRQC